MATAQETYRDMKTDPLAAAVVWAVEDRALPAMREQMGVAIT